MREVGERSETDGSIPDIGFTDMGGRVYDSLAGRFTTADPIMQAPFWSQGQNRYAYVFNDPINATDPSGFMSDSEIAGGSAPALIGGSITGGTFLAQGIRGAAGSVGASAGLTGLDVLHTLLLTPGGPPPNTSYPVATPTAAPTTSLNKANGMGSAPGAAQPPGPPPSLAELRAEFGMPDEREAAVPICGPNPPKGTWCMKQAPSAFDFFFAGGVVAKGGQVTAPVLVRLFNWLVGRGAAKLLVNQMPAALAGEMAAATRVGAAPIKATAQSLEKLANQGTLKWVVTEGGELVVSPLKVKGVEISHAVLSGGRPVLAAGHVEIAAGGGQFVGLGINANSGHFGQGVVDVGKAAFARLGIVF